MERYQRQTILEEFGEIRQRQLEASSILIVGLGGLGSPVASYLVSSGIGHIGLCDNDIVSITNLQRQILYTEQDLGKPKVTCAYNRLQAMSSTAVFDIYDKGITPDTALDIIPDYDIVVDCTDNFAARLIIDDVCAQLGKPWVHGSIDGFYGTITVFNHNHRKRYIDLYPDAKILAEENESIVGTLGPIPGIIGSMQALETIKVLTDCGDVLDGRLLLLSLDSMLFQIVEF